LHAASLEDMGFGLGVIINIAEYENGRTTHKVAEKSGVST
jgi:hypothetical protein